MAVIWTLFIFVLIFCLAGIFLGAPYLPTLNKQVEAALELVNLDEGQTLLELGCGDGRVLIAAAKRGLKAVGYEINPVLFLISYLRTRKYRAQVKVIWGNYWQKEWPPADGVFVFLINRYMAKLDSRLKQYYSRPLKLVSFAFKIPGKEIVDSKFGVFLYLYT